MSPKQVVFLAALFAILFVIFSWDSDNTCSISAGDSDMVPKEDMSRELTGPDQAADVEVFCWLMVTEPILSTSTVHVRDTWCKRCTKALYLGDVTNTTFPVVGLGTQESNRTLLTVKRNKAMDYLYKYHINDSDWFLKADSDSYVIMENLRHFLSHFDPRDPLVIGQLWTNPGGVVYPAGGGGYVLSKEALRRFGERDQSLCELKKLDGAEEIHLATCLKKLNVKFVDTVDNDGLPLAHQFSLVDHIRGRLPRVYLHRVSEDANKAPHRVSREAISFHYQTPDEIHTMEYLIYQLKLFHHDNR